MRAFAERDPRVLALAGIAAIAVLVTAAFNVDELPLIGAADRYEAVFSDAAGIVPGEPVMIAGIKVGTVDEVELEGDEVVVSFSMDDATLTEETRASIEIKSLLGQHYLGLQPAGDGSLPAGSRIPRSRTSTPMNVLPALQQTSRTVDEIDTDKLTEALDTLSGVLSNTAPEVRETLDGLSALSHTIAERDAQLQELFREARDISGTIATRNDRISELIGSATRVMQTLQNRKDSIRTLLEETTELAGQLSGLVRDNEAQFAPALSELNEVLAVLEENERNIDEALTQLAPYARLFTNVVGSGHWFDTVVKIPRGFAACSNPHGNPLTDLTDPVLSDVNEQITGSSEPCLPLGPSTDSEGGR